MGPSSGCFIRMVSLVQPGETGPCMWTRHSGLFEVRCAGPMINGWLHHLGATNTNKMARSLPDPLIVRKRIDIFLKGLHCTACGLVARFSRTPISVWVNAE